MNFKFRVLAATACGWPVREHPPLLGEMLSAAGIPRIRRINRLIQLALLGSYSCAQSLAIGGKIDGVVLATGQGSIVQTISALKSLFVDGRSPTPVEFINLSHNLPAHYVGRVLGVSGFNQTITATLCAFEAAMDVAASSMLNANAHTCLVGGVDEVVTPIEEHRRRLGVAEQTVLGEGSSWLTISTKDADGLGEIQCFPSILSLNELLEKLGTEIQGGADFVSFGLAVNGDVREKISRKLGFSPVHHEYYERCGYFDTATAFGIADFFSKRGTLVHVSAVSTDGYRLTLAMSRGKS